MGFYYLQLSMSAYFGELLMKDSGKYYFEFDVGSFYPNWGQICFVVSREKEELQVIISE